jgi:DNA modification methylase
MSGFVEFNNNQANGKNLLSLQKSRKIRNNFINIFGNVPESILKHDRHDKALDLYANDRSYKNTSKKMIKKAHPEFTEKELKLFCLSHQGAKDGALSRFPQNIGRLLVNFYCPQDGVVYDPFAGHNSRMELVWKTGRNYIGVDVSKEFMIANRQIREMLLQKNRNSLGLIKKKEINLIEGSSNKVDLPDNYADFTLTSPPYWNIEYYGDEKEQLGNTKTYEDFIDLIFFHIKENFRILKPGAWCCWFINDFKSNGKYYVYHSDIAHLMEKAGFILESIYIVDLGRSVQKGFVQILFQRGVFPKRHEYCIVGRKPGEKIFGINIDDLLK